MEILRKYFLFQQVIHTKSTSYPHFVDKNVDNFLYKISIFSLTESQLFTIIRRGMKKNVLIFILDIIYRFELNQGGGYQ